MPPPTAGDSSETETPWTPSPFLLTIAVILGILLLIVFFGSWFNVGAGEVGVVFNKINGQTESTTKGFHMKIPMAQAVTFFDVRTQKLEYTEKSSSKDLQDVTIQVALNYHLDYEHVDQLFVKVGKDYESLVIDPNVNESVKAASAQFDVEEVIVQREKLRTLIESALKSKLLAYYIVVESVNLTHIDFDPEFNKVVEEKQIEQQKIKTAEYQKMQAEQQKQTTILQAEGEAQKQKLLRQSVDADIIALKWIEKWGGDVPQVMGGSGGNNMLMLDMSKLASHKVKKEASDDDSDSK
jgi:regulator of protease activity HflC (stomatin/prohibitin superfamily)